VARGRTGREPPARKDGWDVRLEEPPARKDGRVVRLGERGRGYEQRALGKWQDGWHDEEDLPASGRSLNMNMIMWYR
jgi:hypothetical protein